MGFKWFRITRFKGTRPTAMGHFRCNPITLSLFNTTICTSCRRICLFCDRCFKRFRAYLKKFRRFYQINFRMVFRGRRAMRETSTQRSTYLQAKISTSVVWSNQRVFRVFGPSVRGISIFWYGVDRWLIRIDGVDVCHVIEWQFLRLWVLFMFRRCLIYFLNSFRFFFLPLCPGSLRE